MSSASGLNEVTPTRVPNIVMIVSDQHRADWLGCAGNRAVRTPHPTGPDLPRGRTLGTPASLVDLFPTILHGAGVPIPDRLPGRSLWPLLSGPEDRDREIFCEYHGHGTPGAAYLLRAGSLKYVHYVGYRPQLFDLAPDPGERHDLAPDMRYAGALATFEAHLRAIVDPCQ